MIGIQELDGEIVCSYGDILVLQDNSYYSILGDYKSGYVLNGPFKLDKIKRIDQNETHLYSDLKLVDNGVCVLAGETSYGGAGFIALKSLDNSDFLWLLHLSNMNNPKRLRLEDNVIRLTTDLVYPEGVDFHIPVSNPQHFTTSLSDGNW